MTIDRLLSIADAARRSAPPEAAEWFIDAIDGYLREKIPLEACLDLGSTGPGQITARTRWSKARRDEALRKAYEQIDPDLLPSHRVDRLFDEIRAFECRVLPQWRDLDRPPENCSQLRKHLWDAIRTGEKMPKSSRSLWRLIFEY